jgi:hypothetical protein
MFGSLAPKWQIASADKYFNRANGDFKFSEER